MNSRSSSATTLAGLLSLLLACLLSLPLLERLIAAVWQWYKFEGYSNDGHINLSFGTGLFFSALLAGAFVFALCVNYLARRQAAVVAGRVSSLAMILLALLASGYWLLALSSLNVWRP